MTHRAAAAPVLARAPTLAGYAFPAAVTAVLGGYALLLGWDVFHYDWLRGYDAWHNSLYANVIQTYHRLPTKAETGVWHTPPLFFAVAAVVRSLAAVIGWPAEPHRAVQLFDAIAALGVAALAFLTARELFSRSRIAQVGALCFAVLTPVLARGAIMYHPEPLATLLATAGLYVVVRVLCRDRPSLRAGLVAGALLGLAQLTRSWALAVLVGCCVAVAAHYVFSRRRETLRMGATLLVAGLALAAPWYVYQEVVYGSPFAFSRPAPHEPFFRRRPSSFYVGLSVDRVFTRPYEPSFRNQLLPTVYTDWWGDYWRYFRVPQTMLVDPPRLPGKYHRPLVIQSFVGILPALLALIGLLDLAYVGVRWRMAAAVAIPAVVLVLGLAYLAFQIRYPSPDGDTLKSLYLLDAVVPTALAGGWALARIRRLDERLFAAVAVVLLAVAFLDVRFLTLA